MQNWQSRLYNPLDILNNIHWLIHTPRRKPYTPSLTFVCSLVKRIVRFSEYNRCCKCHR